MLYLTRAEYDALVGVYPQWMAEVWPLLRKRWGLGGVTVCEVPALLGYMVAVAVGERRPGPALPLLVGG